MDRGTVGLGRKGCATTQIKKYVACDSLKNQFSIKIVGFPSFIQMPNVYLCTQFLNHIPFFDMLNEEPKVLF